VTGTFTQNGAGANSLGADITTTNSNMSFATAITLTQNVQLSTGAGAGDITLSSTVNGAHNFTLLAGTGNITILGVAGGLTPLQAINMTAAQIVLFSIGIGAPGADSATITATIFIQLTGNNYRTTSAQTLSAPQGVRFTGSPGVGTWQATSISLPATDLYLDFNGLSLTLLGNLSVRDFIFYRGTFNPSGQTITISRNYAVFGAGYNPLDADRNLSHPGNAFFACPEAGGFLYYPGGGTYNAGTGAFSVAPNAALGSMDASTWNVSGNWYHHGSNLSAANNWSLSIPDNSNANPVANPPFGTPYARLFRSSVAYGQITSAAGSAVSAPTSGDEGNTNAGNNDVFNDVTDDPGWNFTRLEIVSARTLYDDLIEVTFNQRVANIGNTLATNILALRVGDVAHTTNTQPFEEVIVDFSNPASPVYSHQGGVPQTNVLYFRVTTPAKRWNTDATGLSAGMAISTDRHGVHRTNIPNLSFIKGNFYARGGKNLVMNYNFNGSPAYTATTDHARPVLVAVTAARAAHNPGGPYTNYDAHNYFFLRYSEPVNLVGGPPPAATNFQSSSTWGDATGAGTVTVFGFFSYPGTLERFNRDGVNHSQVHSIYRAAPNPAGQHGVLIFIAGYSNAVLWDGYIRDVTNPIGQSITVGVNPNIQDLSPANNQLEPTVDSYISTKPIVTISNQDTLVGSVGNHLNGGSLSLPISGYDSWDIEPPRMAPYWPVAPQPNPFVGVTLWELVVKDTNLDNEIDTLEMHFMDNPSSYTDWHSTVAPSYHNQTSTIANPRGIRESSFTNLDAFQLRKQGQTAWSGAGTVIGLSTIVQTPPFVVVPSSINNPDDQYITLVLSVAPRGWAPIDTLEMIYNETTGMVTDLAGNLLRTILPGTPWVSIEKTPPRIHYTLAGVGMNRIYVRFSEKVFNGASFGSPLTSAHFGLLNFSATLSVVNVTPINGTWASGVNEVFLELNQGLTPDDLVLGRIHSNASPNHIIDAAQNDMVNAIQYLATNVGLGLVQPLWATDGSEGVTNVSGINRVAQAFDGSQALMPRNIDLQVQVNPALSTPPIPQLFFDVDASDPLLGNRWLTQQITELSAQGNSEARTLLPYQSSAPLHNYRIPSSDSEIKVGKELTFLFQLGTLPVARPLNPNDPREWDLYRLKIRDVTRQKGGVTILNNVINPEIGEKTTLLYQMSDSGIATVQVFALDGSSVRVLYRGRQAAGEYQATWDGRNESGRVVARGPYFIRVSAPGVDEIRTVMIVK